MSVTIGTFGLLLTGMNENLAPIRKFSVVRIETLGEVGPDFTVMNPVCMLWWRCGGGITGRRGCKWIGSAEKSEQQPQRHGGTEKINAGTPEENYENEGD